MAKKMFHRESHIKNIKAIMVDRLEGVTVEDLVNKYGGSYQAMHTFLTEYEIHRDTIPGIRSTTFNKLDRGVHKLDGSPYCIKRRGCPTYVAIHIDEYRKLIGDIDDA